jgi:hypothetical protein
MLYCPKCKIAIRGKKQCCPLCEGKILDKDGMKRAAIDEDIYDIDDFEEDDEAFPILNERKITGVTFMRICTFILAIVIVVCITLRYLFGEMMSWTGATILGSIVVWLDIIAIMKYRYNILKVLAVEVMVAIIVDYYIDKMTGFYGWSVVWMIPFCLIGHTIVTYIIAKAMKLRFEEYISYIAFDAVLSFAQIFFIWRGENHLPYAAVFTMAGFAIVMVAAIIFRFRELRSAAGRMFNV